MHLRGVMDLFKLLIIIMSIRPENIHNLMMLCEQTEFQLQLKDGVDYDILKEVIIKY